MNTTMITLSARRVPEARKKSHFSSLPSHSARPFAQPANRERSLRRQCQPEGGSAREALHQKSTLEDNQPDSQSSDHELELNSLLVALPSCVSNRLWKHESRDDLLEIVLDLGRAPVARFFASVETLSDQPITRQDLDDIMQELGEFGPDNRSGIEGTLHRISGIRNRTGDVVGLTCRCGRAVQGPVAMVTDLLHDPQSILILGRPGIGKTTVIRDISRTLADDMHRRVVIVDTSNEIGGDGDVPHPALGSARRMQVPRGKSQADVMIEAVENHMPEVIVVDEIGTAAEAIACRTIAERGVTLVATAHGQYLENLMNNPLLSDLIGGLESVTLGDDTARSRNCQKAVLERRAPSTFPVLIEMRERNSWVEHKTEESVDSLLLGDSPYVKVRQMDPKNGAVSTNTAVYTDLAHLEPSPAPSFNGVAPVKAAYASGSRSPRASVDERSPASPSTPSAAAMGYDAMADSLNEQYSVSVPASDFNDFGSSSPSSFEEDFGMEWMQDMDDVSILTAMSRNMMPGARESVGKSRTSTGKGRRNGAAGAKRSTNG